MKKQPQLLTVGIGASAGGLAVLKTFVRSLPAHTGMSFIVIQHLDPTHKSMLSELLGRECILPVQHAEDGQVVETDHVYVIPPHAYLELKDGKLKLTAPDDTRGSRKAIDHFFRSLAAECGDRCAGIVLSGSGSDGTAGLRAIKAAGGLALAQDPATAEHSSMPRSAVDAEVIDKILRVEEIATLLKQYAEQPLSMKPESDPDNIPAEERLEEVTALLKTYEDFNLRQYKTSTVQRRIARRMSLIDIDDYTQYLDRLREGEEERKQLIKDLLINVTDFFRDPEAFHLLEDTIIPETLKRLDKQEDIRIWVAGCASGEEAYSIAILWLEGLAKFRRSNPVRIFATDIDEYAIKIARKGIYPDSITGEIPQAYLEKYFTPVADQHQYRIKNQVRDLISFAAQNVAVDPPFSHMHLISCRNLLIYLKKEVQEKVLSAFYFSLEKDAYLILGSSETLGNKTELFKTVSKKWRAYKKVPGHDRKKMALAAMPMEEDGSPRHKGNHTYRPSHESLSRADQFRRAMLQTFMPPPLLLITTAAYYITMEIGKPT